MCNPWLSERVFHASANAAGVAIWSDRFYSDISMPVKSFRRLRGDSPANFA
jgi:hypothetical protein